jgi:hypothetical protein
MVVIFPAISFPPSFEWYALIGGLDGTGWAICSKSMFFNGKNTLGNGGCQEVPKVHVRQNNRRGVNKYVNIGYYLFVMVIILFEN